MDMRNDITIEKGTPKHFFASQLISIKCPSDAADLPHIICNDFSSLFQFIISRSTIPGIKGSEMISQMIRFFEVRELSLFDIISPAAGSRIIPNTIFVERKVHIRIHYVVCSMPFLLELKFSFKKRQALVPICF